LRPLKELEELILIYYQGAGRAKFLGTSAVGAVEDHGSCFKKSIVRPLECSFGENDDLSVTPEWLSKLRNLKGLMPHSIRIIQQ
jgi:hypothetical protein